MYNQEIILRSEERIVFQLRDLYHQYGYSQYKMSKFEEYDLYAKNKDFLISDSVITFTDTNGKLMALKPDVTLSIVRNSRNTESEVQKVYYNENVYRVSKGTHSFKEIMQVGIECIGNVGDYEIAENCLLAAKSLRCISSESVLSISHLGIISDMIEKTGITGDTKAKVLKCLVEKNIHEMKKICQEAEVEEDAVNKFCTLVNVYGKAQDVFPKLKDLGCSEEKIEQLKSIMDVLEAEDLGDMISFDFSIASDLGYYNGIAFKGFINGVPSAVISGGQYDKLLKKMKKKGKAIGFAVYMDLLERFNEQTKDFDVDAVLLYDDKASLLDVSKAVRQYTEKGMSVLAVQNLPEKLRYQKLLTIKGSEVTEGE